MSKKLVNAIADMREEEALKLVKEMVEGGSEPLSILDAAREAMDIVGQRYEKGIYFLPELMLAGEMMNQITEIIKPKLAEMPDRERQGKVLVGTVQGDIHDIGKNIVAILLKGAGYEVHDLGVDVPEEKVVEFVREEKPGYLGLSALLTTTMTEMGVVIKALEGSKLRSSVKVLIGGAAVSNEFAQEIGADAYCVDAFQAVKVLEEFEIAKA